MLNIKLDKYVLCIPINVSVFLKLISTNGTHISLDVSDTKA